MQRSALCLRRLFACVVLALVSTSACGVGYAQGSEYQAKAATIFRIIKYINWPEKKLKAESPLVIGVLGQDAMMDRLSEAVVGQTHRGHPIVVKRITALPEVEGCHVVFVGRSQDPNARDITRRVGKEAVTIGESAIFVQNGGMFVLQPEPNDAMRIRASYDKRTLMRSKLKFDDEALRTWEELQ